MALQEAEADGGEGSDVVTDFSARLIESHGTVRWKDGAVWLRYD